MVNVPLMACVVALVQLAVVEAALFTVTVELLAGKVIDPAA
jgi:hypothetical protein